MKKILILLFTVTLFLACNNNLDDFLVELPLSIDLGKSEIYLNGELSNFETFIFVNEVSARPNVLYAFGQGEGMTHAYAVSFGQVPLIANEFRIIDKNQVKEFGVSTETNFFHTYQRDLDGYDYEPIRLEEGYLNIEVFDTTARVAQGNFLAFFKRTARNGVRDDELNLPKRIVVQGVFHEKFAE